MRELNPSVTLVVEINGRKTVDCELDIHESNSSPTDDPGLYKRVDPKKYPLWGNIKYFMPWNEEVEGNHYGTFKFVLKPPAKIKNEKVNQGLIRITMIVEGGSSVRFQWATKWILSGDKVANELWTNHGVVSLCEGNDRQPGPADVPQNLSLKPVHSVAADRCWLQPADGRNKRWC